MKRMRMWVALALMTLSGCAAERIQPPAPTVMRYPVLDSKLAALCDMPAGPDAPDYDSWQAWVEGPLLRAFADCAIRHRETVAAWPRAPN